ncbi:hypothetical protein BDR07DRAFT_1378125 [Suillus spraguei]|nr:hypothetical protein BDR07DRAFT_1378125 [Suillus spraguei]
MPNSKTTSHCSQGLSRCHPKVILSKEARALLTSQCRQKCKGFKTALNNAWLHIDEMVKTIASSHHKSIQCVTNDLYMGCGGLCFKHSKSNAWNAFCWKKNQEAKDDNEYEENKLLKSKVWSSTNIPLHGIIFATKGVNDFMASVMNIDDQHLVSKMEGFAIQGMCCPQLQGLLFGEICQIMPIFALEEITKVPKAMMQWANYWHNIVQRYRVICEGWPTHIPFKNLSKASTSLPELQILHDMWKNKLISWRSSRG